MDSKNERLSFQQVFTAKFKLIFVFLFVFGFFS